MSFEGKVAVAGTTGRTGKHIVAALREQGLSIKALARSKEKAAEIAGEGVEIVEGHLKDQASLAQLVEGCAGSIISIGAGPQRREDPDGKPEVFYLEGQTPELIDYQGQHDLLAAAKSAGITHAVQISSIGATQPDHFLNKMGGERALEWKLKAEDELRASGLRYTVIRPGGLDRGGPEQRKLAVGTGDQISGGVNRQDVAAVVVHSLILDEGANKTFELIAEEGPATTDFRALLAGV